MAYRYRVMPEADGDLVEIEDYVTSSSLDPTRADALDHAFITTFRRLCQYPLWHPVYPFPDGMQPRHEYRSVNVDTYKVFHRVDEERELVLIYRIRHAASDFTAVEFG